MTDANDTAANRSMLFRTAGGLTFPQRRVLGDLMRATVGRTAKSLGVRSDVLWRLEERGLVSRNLHDEWRIRPEGERQYERAMETLYGD